MACVRSPGLTQLQHQQELVMALLDSSRQLMRNWLQSAWPPTPHNKTPHPPHTPTNEENQKQKMHISSYLGRKTSSTPRQCAT
jgi:hypothetical protein